MALCLPVPGYAQLADGFGPPPTEPALESDVPCPPPGRFMRGARGDLLEGLPPDGENPYFPQKERFRGPGEPLLRESWTNRPLSFSGMFGLLEGGPLVDDWLGLTQGFVGGFRLGWDHGNYWGLETRFAFGEADIYDSARARAIQVASDEGRHAKLFYWDVIDLVYYPWGDSRWRPYLLAGVGITKLEFADRFFQRYDHTAFSLPLAIGLKYRWTDCTALRFELGDDIAVSGGGVNTLHSLEFTAGIELRFGGPRRAYWPWNPSRQYW